MTRINPVIKDPMAEMEMLGRWISFKTAQKYSSMSRHTLMKYIKSGEVYGVLKGGKWYVDRLSIDAFYLDEGYDEKVVQGILAEMR